MNQRKAHISPWVALLLAAVVTLGCILAAVGISYARYRSGMDFTRIFGVREKGTVLLGTLDEAGIFTEGQGTWKIVDGVQCLDFVISNGTDEAVFSTADQIAEVRVLAGPAWDNTLTLTVNEISYTATATAIKEGSALYRSFGEGWILQFRDEQGNLLTWDLAGGMLSTWSMRLSLSEEQTDVSLLRLQIVAEEAE